jgi:hypothetical protein
MFLPDVNFKTPSCRTFTQPTGPRVQMFVRRVRCLFSRVQTPRVQTSRVQTPRVQTSRVGTSNVLSCTLHCQKAVKYFHDAHSTCYAVDDVTHCLFVCRVQLFATTRRDLGVQRDGRASMGSCEALVQGRSGRRIHPRARLRRREVHGLAGRGQDAPQPVEWADRERRGSMVVGSGQWICGEGEAKAKAAARASGMFTPSLIRSGKLGKESTSAFKAFFAGTQPAQAAAAGAAGSSSSSTEKDGISDPPK